MDTAHQPIQPPNGKSLKEVLGPFIYTLTFQIIIRARI
jgi:hypothetical protein